MAETSSGTKTRVRSPGFPFIGLKKAIERARGFYDQDKRNWANVKVAVKHWGFNEASSGGKQTVAALMAYGLLESKGIGDARQVRLSETALRIILDTRDSSWERDEALQRAALKPKLHNELWKHYPEGMPSNQNLRHFLVVVHKPPFNEKWVDHFIGEFRATLAFAKIDVSDTMSEEGEDKRKTEVGNGADDRSTQIKVGDCVQWESQGVLQFEAPKRVRALSDDTVWAFVEGSETGLPVKELTVQEPAANELNVPPKMALSQSDAPTPPHQKSKEIALPVGISSDGEMVFAYVRFDRQVSKGLLSGLRDALDSLEKNLAEN